MLQPFPSYFRNGKKMKYQTSRNQSNISSVLILLTLLVTEYYHGVVHSFSITATTKKLVRRNSNFPLFLGTEIESEETTKLNYKRSPLSYSVDELTEILDGKGRAMKVWDCLRRGQNPTNVEESGLGKKALTNLYSAFPSLMRGGDIFESNICKVEQVSKSPLSTKLLIRYLHDNSLVETVIIPMNNNEDDTKHDNDGTNKKKNKRPYSTLCVSSQVGCRQGCTFCDTGRMGKLRSLTTDEILAQFYLAQKYNIQNVNDKEQYDIENIVFMGMGEPADNVEAVTEAVRIMTGRTEFQIAPKHVAISTVGISPESFTQLVQNTSATLAWSVHASDDGLRRQLVPTTNYTMVQLRQGLINALTNREQSSRNMRRVLLEVTLIKNVNDNKKDAEHLANFVTELQQLAPPKTKVTVNLIPYNPSSSGNIVIRGIQYETSPLDRVSAFQKTLIDKGIRTYTRTTRGDEDAAACGQLATKKLMLFEKQQQQERLSAKDNKNNLQQ